MKKTLLEGAAIALFLFILSPGTARAQNVAANGDFELQAQGPWDLTGDNAGVECLKYDTSGNGVKSWCWKRLPGSNPFGGGNGGLAQAVNLVAGVTYEFSARICYLSTC